jgi:hypothetical protein
MYFNYASVSHNTYSVPLPQSEGKTGDSLFCAVQNIATNSLIYCIVYIEMLNYIGFIIVGGER